VCVCVCVYGTAVSVLVGVVLSANIITLAIGLVFAGILIVFGVVACVRRYLGYHVFAPVYS